MSESVKAAGVWSGLLPVLGMACCAAEVGEVSERVDARLLVKIQLTLTQVVT